MRFVLVCEGWSDAALVSHIQRLLVQCGCANPRGTPFPWGSRIAEKIGKAVELANDLDLLFVHRDANNIGAEKRYLEIKQAVENTLPLECRWVAVVPVRMTEAWLLLDEAAIRRVVRKPNGKQPLGLPSPRHAERVSDPKDVLSKALLAAVATTGRRRRKFKQEFPRLRRILLEDLPIGGRLESLPSWRAFRDATQTAVADVGQPAPPAQS